MLIRNIKEFLKKIKTKKILALDMGKKKIGIALSDPNHKIVNPLEVLKKDKNYLDKLLLIIKDFNIGGILIGLPITNSDKNKMSQMIKDIGKNLRLCLTGSGSSIDLIKILDILGIEEIICRLSYNLDRS